MKNLPLIYLEANPPKLSMSISFRNVWTWYEWCPLLLDFIEYDAAGLVYSKQAHNGTNNSEYTQKLKVRTR